MHLHMVFNLTAWAKAGLEDATLPKPLSPCYSLQHQADIAILLSVFLLSCQSMGQHMPQTPCDVLGIHATWGMIQCIVCKLGRPLQHHQCSIRQSVH